jgi:hypothetical protein
LIEVSDVVNYSPFRMLLVSLTARIDFFGS